MFTTVVTNLKSKKTTMSKTKFLFLKDIIGSDM